jgi:predicted DNA-binding transcriptional regulator YafY
VLGTSARLLRVLALLQSRRFWSGDELAEALGITPRSVRRDIDRLRDLGYPVHATAGVGGGYRLGAGKELPPLPLDDEEAVAVAVGLRAAAVGPVKGMEAAALRALSKLEQVLPKRLRRRVNALQSVSVTLADPRPAIDAETLTTLANACRDAETVRFEYRSHGGTETTRSVEPYRLVHTSYRWYLLAFDLDRTAWRTFRMDRVGPRPRPGRRFAPRPLPNEDVAAYVAASLAETPRVQARVTVHANAEAVTRRMTWMTGRVEPLGLDRCLLHLDGESLDGLCYGLVFLGFDFRVEDPPALTERIGQIAARLGRAVAIPDTLTASPAPRSPASRP